MALFDKWVALKIVEFLACVACLVGKRVSADDEARLSLLLQKLSREWSLLTSVTWDSVGGAFADAIYGGYVIITFGLLIARIFQEIPKGRRILEGFFLGFGMLFFLILGGLELASLDSVPHNLVVNASVLGSLSLLVAALFLVDLLGPRAYTAARHSQTDPVSALTTDKTVTVAAQRNGLLSNGKPNGVERPKDLDLGKTDTTDAAEKGTNGALDGHLPKFDSVEPKLEKSKFGSVRNGIESGNYVRLSDPMSEPDKVHYERELAAFNERYFREYLDNFAGKLSVREDYLPEPQTPKFSKVRSGRLRSLYDEVSPSYERAREPPARAKTAPAPTMRQLEEYLRPRARADTPGLFPLRPISEAEDARAAGSPADPGYVQYAADRWPERRELRTPRHSPK